MLLQRRNGNLNWLLFAERFKFNWGFKFKFDYFQYMHENFMLFSKLLFHLYTTLYTLCKSKIMLTNFKIGTWILIKVWPSGNVYFFLLLTLSTLLLELISFNKHIIVEFFISTNLLLKTKWNIFSMKPWLTHEE